MTQRSARSVFEFNITASYTHSVSSALRAALSPFLDAALPVGRTPSQRLRVLLRICSDCTTPQLCATGSRVGGSGCFNLALGPSHLRHSARVLTTSHVPTHNACATKQSHAMSWVLNTLLPLFLSHGMIPFFQPDLSRWHLGILWNARFSQCRWPPIPENLKLWSCNDG